MVQKSPDHMAAVKKFNLRRSLASQFGRKSSKKATELFVSDEGAIVASPLEGNNPNEFQKNKDNAEPELEMDIKSRPTMVKAPSGKSHKWPFRNRRSEDHGSVKNGLKRNLSEDHGNGAEPGSRTENVYSKGTGPAVVSHAGGEQGVCALSGTGAMHQFHKHLKGEGYVVPLRRQDKPVNHDAGDKLSQHLQEVDLNDRKNWQDMPQSQHEGRGAGRDVNSISPHSPPLASNVQIIPNGTTDSAQQVISNRSSAPPLPPPLRKPVEDSDTEPDEVPPRIPPKPASLRNRPLRSPDPVCSFNGISGEDDCEVPPRPPARPKNRSHGKGLLLPWNTQLANPSDNRATIYETISLEPKEASLAKELAKLPRQPWYWGPLTQAQAEEKLAKLPDGNFLVRDSSDERYLLSLSFNSHGRTLHTRIEHRNGLFSLNDSDGHTSVVELITCAVKESRSGVYGYMRDALGVQSFPARLTDWVSRFTEMRSLQHLCRFLIREVYPRHHIQRLPLPKKIKEYILENQY